MDEKLKQQIVQLLQSASQGDKQATQAIQNIMEQAKQGNQEAVAIAQAIQQVAQEMQGQVQRAEHGAKLQYFKKLKNQCADDEELVYYRRGGSVDCGCAKKKEGGKTPKSKNIVEAFKAKRGAVLAEKKTVAAKTPVNPSDTVHVNGRAYSLTNSDGTPVDGRFPPYLGKVEQQDRKKAKAGDKNAKKRQQKADLVSSEKNGGKAKKGGEVCPKCGKIHKAGVSCSIAAFKERFKNGGSLNEVPFYQEGSQFKNFKFNPGYSITTYSNGTDSIPNDYEHTYYTTRTIKDQLKGKPATYMSKKVHFTSPRDSVVTYSYQLPTTRKARKENPFLGRVAYGTVIGPR